MDFSQTSISKHYIRNSIRKCYARKIFLPGLVLCLLLFLWIFYPIRSTFFPTQMKQGDSLASYSGFRGTNVSVTIDHLYFTGYTSSMFGRSTGYYYYTIWNNKCLIVLMSPSSCQEGLSNIDNITINASIQTPGRSINQLMFNLSTDLNWTSDGLLEQMDAYYLNEVSITGNSNKVFTVFFIGCMIYTALYLFTCILWVLFPLLSPSVLSLLRFGNPWELFSQAEEELATLPQLATEDMFITETFFIEVSLEGVAVVPIQEIIWIYKHSTLHKFLWYHFVISYTLHINGTHHFYIRCPKNIKSDIDGIMDYLAEANHNILVGFNEVNRLKVQELQHRGGHLEHIFEFLKRRI